MIKKDSFYRISSNSVICLNPSDKLRNSVKFKSVNRDMCGRYSIDRRFRVDGSVISISDRDKKGA